MIVWIEVWRNEHTFVSLRFLLSWAFGWGTWFGMWLWWRLGRGIGCRILLNIALYITRWSVCVDAQRITLRHDRSTRWPIWVVGWLIDWSVSCLIETTIWSMDWLIDLFIDWLTNDWRLVLWNNKVIVSVLSLVISCWGLKSLKLIDSLNWLKLQWSIQSEGESCFIWRHLSYESRTRCCFAGFCYNAHRAKWGGHFN